MKCHFHHCHPFHQSTSLPSLPHRAVNSISKCRYPAQLRIIRFLRKPRKYTAKCPIPSLISYIYSLSFHQNTVLTTDIYRARLDGMSNCDSTWQGMPIVLGGGVNGGVSNWMRCHSLPGCHSIPPGADVGRNQSSGELSIGAAGESSSIPVTLAFIPSMSVLIAGSLRISFISFWLVRAPLGL